MRLVCLGTTGYHPSQSRHTACYYLPDQGIVLDAGTGLFRLIDQLLQAPRRHIDLILSHAHLDHIVGLTFLLDVMTVTGLEQVRIWGQADKLDAVREHLFHAALFPVAPSYDFRPLAGASGRVPLAEAELEYFPLDHPGGSTGMLISTADKRLAYVTDTTPQHDPQLAKQLQGVDLLLHECYFGDQHQQLGLRTGHSWLSAVTEFVKLTRPRQTLLIHVNPLATDAENELGLDAEHRELGMRLAEDGMVVQV
ncbi:MAG: MBL fold metallo-hydrolase [Pirellulaceae bacterium]|nr:MBL fold metallo-hydrolase [Pirellulaceae bacterium]